MIFRAFFHSPSSRITSQSESVTLSAFEPPQSRDLTRHPQFEVQSMVEHIKHRRIFDLPPELLVQVFLLLPWKRVVLCELVGSHPPLNSLRFTSFVRYASDSTRSSLRPPKSHIKLNSPSPDTKMARRSAGRRSPSDSKFYVKHKRGG